MLHVNLLRSAVNEGPNSRADKDHHRRRPRLRGSATSTADDAIAPDRESGLLLENRGDGSEFYFSPYDIIEHGAWANYDLGSRQRFQGGNRPAVRRTAESLDPAGRLSHQGTLGTVRRLPAARSLRLRRHPLAAHDQSVAGERNQLAGGRSPEPTSCGRTVVRTRRKIRLRREYPIWIDLILRRTAMASISTRVDRWRSEARYREDARVRMGRVDVNLSVSRALQVASSKMRRDPAASDRALSSPRTRLEESGRRRPIA